MFVSMWMTKEVRTVTPNAPLAEIASLMAHHRIRRLPVLAADAPDAKLVGLISSQDVLHAFPINMNPFSYLNGQTPAQHAATLPDLKLTANDVMVRNPVTTAPDAPIEQVAKLMRERKIGALPVVRHEALVGLITESDIFRAFADVFDPGTHGVRITFDNSHGEDVFPLIADVTSRHGLRVTSFISLVKHERPVCVVQVIGQNTDAMLDDIWKSQHPVISVIQLEGEPAVLTPMKKPVYYKG